MRRRESRPISLRSNVVEVANNELLSRKPLRYIGRGTMHIPYLAEHSMYALSVAYTHALCGRPSKCFNIHWWS